MAISQLVEVEFASVLARLVRMGELDGASANAIQGAFVEDIVNGCYRVLDLTAAHLTRARDWLLERKASLRVLDALHLAIAHSCSAQLVTADAVLADAARRHQVPVKLFKS